MSGPLHVIALSGSLRGASYNTALLGAARELAPPGLAIEVASIADIPLYDDDVRAVGYPAPVTHLRQAIRDADALLFATPEYNYSVPGVLKNAIDWVSRPPEQPFAGKPAAVISASTGLLGGVRAQYHLRQIAVYLNLHFMNGPEVMVAQAAERFQDGKLVHGPTRDLLAKHLEAFEHWIRRFVTN